MMIAFEPIPLEPARRERIQKVLARAGLGSRRAIEGWITAGRVFINERMARLGDRVVSGDRVQLDGKRLSAKALYGAERTRVWGYYKPAGVMCTRRDESGRPTVFDALPAALSGRWVHVGRLDFNTSGLLLWTNDGALAHRLMHPGTGIEREYAVRVLGAVDDRILDRLRAGVRLDDGPARFESIVAMGGAGANHWFSVILKEGRNRLVKRLWESQGVTVSRLLRLRFGPIALPRERRIGEWWELRKKEVQALQSLCGYPVGAGPRARPKLASATPRVRPANPAGAAPRGRPRKPPGAMIPRVRRANPVGAAPRGRPPPPVTQTEPPPGSRKPRRPRARRPPEPPSAA
ncbi:MAG: pseudouridine synthase [Gammaproteobacteria bacterium]